MKIPFSGLWGEFKAFAFQGNMIELAVAVVIGGAFSTVIHAMVTDLINPAIGYAVTAVKEAKETGTKGLEKIAEVTHIATSQPTSQPTTAPTSQAAAPPVVAVTPPPAPAPAPPPAAPAAEVNKAVKFEWMVGRFPIGDLIGEFLNFLIIAFAVFILIVKLIGGTVKRVGGKPKPGEPTTKECPECLSIIPIKARRCSHCTAILEPAPTTPGAAAKPG